MKKFSIYIVGCLLVLMTSCSLEEQILDTPNPGLIQTEEDVEVLLLGLYSRLNDPNAFKFHGWLMMSLTADDMYSPAGADFGPYAQRTFTSANVSNFWSALNQTIGAANSLISVVDRMDLSSSFKKHVIGEALFIRAFCYYYLVRLYGGVPVRNMATDINSDFYLPRQPIHDVYTQIFSDFRSASERLPTANELSGSQLGRATKGAAQALLAQAYLTYGNQLSLRGQDPKEWYELAVVYTDSVINSHAYTLVDDYADLFDISAEEDAYQEVIFGIRFQVDQQQGLYGSAGSEYAFRHMAPQIELVTGHANNGQGGGQVRPMPWIADFYRTGDYGDGTSIDYRNETAFLQRGIQSSQNREMVTYPNIPGPGQGQVPTPLIGKYIDPDGRDQRNHGNDFFVIRFAEVYLIKAEALNELRGPNPEAFSAFNRTRARARNAAGTMRAVPADVDASTHPEMTKEAFRLKIFHERGLELIGEGQRWFDLVRMQHPNDPTKTMYEYQLMEELTKPFYPKNLPNYQAAQAKYSNSNAVYAPALKVSVPKFLLFPIPDEEMVRNPNFGAQNPDW